MLGEKVVVRHKSVIKPNTGEVFLTLGREIEQTVAQQYMDGRIKTSSGDVWNVTRINGILHTETKIHR